MGFLLRTCLAPLKSQSKPKVPPKHVAIATTIILLALLVI